MKALLLLAAGVLALAGCASLMAAAHREAGPSELLAHGKAMGKAGSDVFSARQGAQDALVRASRDAVQADLMKEALGGGHPWRHMKNAAKAAAAKEAHETAVHHSAAWAAGRKSLAARNPWAGVDHALWERKMRQAPGVKAQSLAAAEAKGHEGKDGDKEDAVTYVPLTKVDTEDVKPEWKHGAHNPRDLVHLDDRYVHSGDIVDHPVEEEEEEEEKDRDDEEEKEHDEARSRQQGLASAESVGMASPTTTGGVRVPGGRVVYMPVGSLARREQARAAPRQAPIPPPVSVRRHRSQDRMEFPRSYSKIVEYGSNGRPIATVYGEDYHQSVVKRANRGRQTTLASPRRVQSLAGPGGDPDVMEDQLSDDSERKIEQDIVFRLLHNFGPPDAEQHSLKPAEEEQLPPASGNQTEHAWYTFGGRIFEGSANRGVPSILPLVLSAVAVVMGALFV